MPVATLQIRQGIFFFFGGGGGGVGGGLIHLFNVYKHIWYNKNTFLNFNLHTIKMFSYETESGRGA